MAGLADEGGEEGVSHWHCYDVVQSVLRPLHDDDLCGHDFPGVRVQFESEYVLDCGGGYSAVGLLLLYSVCG